MHWVRSWGAALMAPENFEDYPGLGRSFHDVTLRQRVVMTVSGHRLRVWFSNQYGNRPLAIGEAHVAHGAADSLIVPGTDRALAFWGRAGISVPPGATVVSDPIELNTSAGTLLAVSLYLPRSTEGSTSTVHQAAWRVSYVSPAGNFTRADSFPVAATLPSHFYIAGVDIEASESVGVIVALGDSVTDGSGSTPGAGHSWPETLARRFAVEPGSPLAVLNMGIGGNRLLHDLTGPSALVRFNRDVLSIPGVRFVLVLEGINDIGGAEWFARPEEDVSADDIISALRQIIAQAHDHGIRVIGGTLTPSAGSLDVGYDSPLGEAKRQAVNAWIRNGREFDSIIDFDRVIRDPKIPSRIKPEYDSGDHLHPSDAGYAAMAGALDRSVFEPHTKTSAPR
jgi:lysophospholipase L1-like esterase